MEVSGQLHAPASLSAGKVPLVPIIHAWEARWTPEPVWTLEQRKFSCHCRGSNDGRPARSLSQYRQSYPSASSCLLWTQFKTHFTQEKRRMFPVSCEPLQITSKLRSCLRESILRIDPVLHSFLYFHVTQQIIKSFEIVTFYFRIKEMWRCVFSHYG
jgi:hypothetical protein